MKLVKQDDSGRVLMDASADEVAVITNAVTEYRAPREERAIVRALAVQLLKAAPVEEPGEVKPSGAKVKSEDDDDDDDLFNETRS